MSSNGSARQNIALAAMAAAVITPFAEKQWGLKLSADDIIDAFAGLALGWHFLVSTFGPYASRVFDHFFPPPAEPASLKETSK